MLKQLRSGPFLGPYPNQNTFSNVHWSKGTSRYLHLFYSQGPIIVTNKFNHRKNPHVRHFSLYLGVMEQLLIGLGVFISDEVSTELEKCLVDIILYWEVSRIGYPHVHTKQKAIWRNVRLSSDALNQGPEVVHFRPQSRSKYLTLLFDPRSNLT